MTASTRLGGPPARAPAGLLMALFAALLAAGIAGPARAGVQVRFAAPGGFTDARSWTGGRSGVAVAADLEAHLRRLARTLPPRRDLAVDVLDIDLAGENRPGVGPGLGTRVVTGATPPRIRLRWRIGAGQRTLSSGEETLSDPYFQWDPSRALSSDPLQAEKALLDGWYRRRIVPAGS